MKIVRMAAPLVLGILFAACGPSGTPGISGEVVLSPNVLISNHATRIFVGAFAAVQIRDDGWPDVWEQAKYSNTINNLTQSPFDYSFTTDSSERLYVYAFLDQNGAEDSADPNPEPNAFDIGGEVVGDVLGRYGSNPATPIDDILKDIDVELGVVMTQ